MRTSMLIMATQARQPIFQMAFITTTSLQTILISMAMVFMERPVRFLNNALFVFAVLMGCSQSLERRIPSVYIAATDLSLKQKRGYLWYRNKHFSGRVYELHPDG